MAFIFEDDNFESGAYKVSLAFLTFALITEWLY